MVCIGWMQSGDGERSSIKSKLVAEERKVLKEDMAKMGKELRQGSGG